jgi:uncharacterized protein DUF4279
MTNEDIKVFLGEQNEVERCNIAFMIAGETLDPNFLTQTLRLEPTHAWAKGDRHLGKSGRDLLRPMGHWSLSTEAFESKSMEKHCRHLIDLLGERESIVRELRSSGKYRVSISIWWQVGETGHGSFNLLSETISCLALASYCDDFEFHFL